MKTFKNLSILSIIVLLTYSCEPEELPENTSMEIEDITVATGDQAEEEEKRKGD
jgi:hypothetical protein|tara:strand:+ start:71 stop:232 length:162 start_codon:yes stop_codon:yes gene_type:complete